MHVYYVTFCGWRIWHSFPESSLSGSLSRLQSHICSQIYSHAITGTWSWRAAGLEASALYWTPARATSVPCTDGSQCLLIRLRWHSIIVSMFCSFKVSFLVLPHSRRGATQKHQEAVSAGVISTAGGQPSRSQSQPPPENPALSLSEVSLVWRAAGLPHGGQVTRRSQVTSCPSPWCHCVHLPNWNRSPICLGPCQTNRRSNLWKTFPLKGTKDFSKL
jgi:hypothetical protein